MNHDNAIEVLLKSFGESFSEARQVENQRTSMSNFLIIITAAIFAFVSSQGFSYNTIPISILMILLGVFGFFMSAKYAQRFHRNYTTVRLIRKRINELCPESQILEIETKSSGENELRYPFLKKRIPILYLWLGLHLVICFMGVLSVIIAIF